MKYSGEALGWQHLSPIPGHAIDADLVCYDGPGAVAAKFALAADVDGDGQAEIVANLDSTTGLGKFVWVMDYSSARGWQHLVQNG